MVEQTEQRREHLYGLHGIYLDAYDVIVNPHNIWPVSHYTLRRWAPILGGSAFWLLIALQQLCYRNSHSPRKNWCHISRPLLAEEASLGEGSIHRLLHEEPYKEKGLCHWIRLKSRRSWSDETKTVVQDVNRYQVVLTPPLVPADQRGLAQYLLENGVEPGASVDTAVPLLENLAKKPALMTF